MDGVEDVAHIAPHDQETVTELRLVTELIVVASMAPGELDQDVVDGALGIERIPTVLPLQRGPGGPGPPRPDVEDA